MTVTATEGGSTFNGVTLRVKVLTSVTGVQPGASHVTDLNPLAAYQTTIVTTTTGSIVYGAGTRSGATSPTVLGNTTAIDTINDATNSYGRDTFRATSATGSPGSTTLGYSTNETGGIATLEILPAGTITEDASGPAVANTNTATTVATASFSPPPLSLLVAMVGCGGAAGSVTMTVSGGGLVWTEQIKTNVAGDDYAGVWTALVPPWPPPVQARQAIKRAAYF